MEREEITPTTQHLCDPYVLQLLREIAVRDDIIEVYREFVDSLKDTPHDWLRARIKELPNE